MARKAFEARKYKNPQDTRIKVTVIHFKEAIRSEEMSFLSPYTDISMPD